jgi:endonuclease/exonuclease/phosphatase family metal-dependent hydrolase
MRIATWNLQRPTNAGSSRAVRMLERIRAIDADVWVLTETHEAISPGDGYRAVATSGSDREQHPGERWTMIWSRLPIVDVETTCDPIRTACARIALDAGPRLLMYGTVLPWRADRRWLPRSGGAAFVQVLGEQAADWRRLRDKYPDDFLCVAGDFNQELGDRTYAGTAPGRAELRRALDAAALECRTGDEVDPVARLTQDERANIDHICFDARAVAGPQTAVGAWPARIDDLRTLSDHFGVWIDVSCSAPPVAS